MKLTIFQQPLEYVKNNVGINRKSQTLVVLLIFILVAITIATTSVSVIISNAESTRAAGQSMEAYYAAEAGVENALLQLLRRPSYTGETLSISPNLTAQIAVTQLGGMYKVTSTGNSGSFTRVIQANLDYTNSILSVISWEEIYQ